MIGLEGKTVRISGGESGSINGKDRDPLQYVARHSIAFRLA
jgi:hypothetical protein